jgi:hypothetical protein
MAIWRSSNSLRTRKKGTLVQSELSKEISLLGGYLGTSYNPPVKPKTTYNRIIMISQMYNFMPFIRRTPPVSLFFSIPLVPTSFSPYGEPAPHRYQYPVCIKATYHPLSRLHDSGERPIIVPHEVLCLYVLARALSPVLVFLLPLCQASQIKHLLLLHKAPRNHQHLCRELHPHLRGNSLFSLPSSKFSGKVGRKAMVRR